MGNELTKDLETPEYPRPTHPSIPASDKDRLSTAVQEEAKVDSAHGPSSLRAEEAWNSIPGEEIAVDIPEDRLGEGPLSDEQLSESQAYAPTDDIPWESDSVALPSGGYVRDAPDLAPVHELRKVGHVSPESTLNFTQIQGEVATMLKGEPELTVEVNISLPDGRRHNLTLAVPEGDNVITADEALELIGNHFDAIVLMLSKSFGKGIRRSSSST